MKSYYSYAKECNFLKENCCKLGNLHRHTEPHNSVYNKQCLQRCLDLEQFSSKSYTVCLSAQQDYGHYAFKKNPSSFIFKVKVSPICKQHRFELLAD